jgi:hypothetical protein
MVNGVKHILGNEEMSGVVGQRWRQLYSLATDRYSIRGGAANKVSFYNNTV